MARTGLADRFCAPAGLPVAVCACATPGTVVTSVSVAAAAMSHRRKHEEAVLPAPTRAGAVHEVLAGSEALEGSKLSWSLRGNETIDLSGEPLRRGTNVRSRCADEM